MGDGPTVPTFHACHNYRTRTSPHAGLTNPPWKSIAGLFRFSYDCTMTEEWTEEAGPEDARKRILRAATELIASHGADRVTHRLAADAAGVSPGTVTYHFTSREDLIREAFDLYSTEYAEGLDEALRLRPLERMEDVPAFLSVLTTLAPEDGNLARFEYEMISQAQRDPALNAAVKLWAGMLPARIAAVLGQFKVERPERTAMLLVQICRGTELDVLTLGLRVPREVFEGRLLALLMAYR